VKFHSATIGHWWGDWSVNNQQLLTGGNKKNINPQPTPAQIYCWQILLKKKKETGFRISFLKMSQYNFVFNGFIHVLTYNLEDVSVNMPFEAF
jgi:hypothetical protein